MVNFKNKQAAMLIKQLRIVTNMKKLHNCILTFSFLVFWISWLMFGRHGLRRNQLLKQQKVGISRQGLNWKWMQEEKFTQSEAPLFREEPDLANHQSTWKAKAPEEVRFGTKDYWRIMYEKQLQICQQQSELPFSLEEIGIFLLK